MKRKILIAFICCLFLSFLPFSKINSQKRLINRIDSTPEIQWDQEEINIQEFSIFDSKDINLTFQVKTDNDFTYKISSLPTWIRVKKSTGPVSDKKISFSVIGWKMNAWQINQSVIHVTFPDYPELNKDFPIEVDVIGSRMVIQIDSGKTTLNEKESTILDPLPIIKKGRIFVGIIFISEFFGCKIDFDASTKGITITARENSIYFETGNSKAFVNGKFIEMDVPPFVFNKLTVFPLRFVCENLGSSVEYEAKTRTITILYPKKQGLVQRH